MHVLNFLYEHGLHFLVFAIIKNITKDFHLCYCVIQLGLLELGDLRTNISFYWHLDLGKSKVKVPVGSVLGEGPFPGLWTASLPIMFSHSTKREGALGPPIPL